MFILREYQKECVELMVSQEEGKYGVVLPPGSGKTVIIANYIKRMKDLSILILVHRDELVSQTTDKLEAYGITSGLEKGSSSVNTATMERLARKIEAKRERCEERIAIMEDTLKEIPDIRDELQGLLDDKLSYNNKLLKKRDEEIANLKLTLSPKSVEYRTKKDRIMRKFQGEVRSTHRIYRSMTKGLEMKAWLAQGSKRYNEEVLARLKDIKSESPSVVIASVQSLREERLALWEHGSFDVVIFDEAHHLRAPTWEAIRDYFDDALQFGFSATWNPSSNGFRTLYSRDYIPMVEEGWLVKPQHLRIDVRDQKIEPDSEKHDAIILSVLKEHKEEKAIVFCASVDQSLRLSPLMPRSFALTCDTPEKERRSAVKKFKESSLMVLFNYQIVYEGFDDPGATLILSRATPDANVYLQATGRGFRPNSWKNSVKICDIIMRDGQCTLPTVFGLHREWEFEGDPFEDAKKAIQFAKDNNLDLGKFPNWGFLKLKKPPEMFSTGPRTRGPGKGYKNVLGDGIKILQGSNGKYAKGVYYGGSNFYTPRDGLNRAIRETLKHELNFKPVSHIDPSTVEGNRVALDPVTLRKTRAAIYVRDHWRYNSFLKKMRYWMAKKPLTETQCEMVIKIGEELEAGLENPVI